MSSCRADEKRCVWRKLVRLLLRFSDCVSYFFFLIFFFCVPMVFLALSKKKKKKKNMLVICGFILCMPALRRLIFRK